MGSPPIPRTTQAHHTPSALTLSQSRHRGGGREWEQRVGILLTTVTLFPFMPTMSRLPSVGSVGLLHRRFRWVPSGGPAGAGPLFLGWGGVAPSNPGNFAPGAQPQRSPGLPVLPPSAGAPQSFFTDCLCVGTQGPPLRCRAPPLSRGNTVPSVRGVRRVERGPNALQGSWCTSGPAGPRGSFTPVSLRGHPGAAPLTQGLFLGPGRHCLFRLRGSTRGARPQRPPGPTKRPSPAPRRQEGQQRRSRFSRGDSVPAAILFFFPLGAGRAAAVDRSLPFATAHLHRLLGIQGSQGESKRHPSLGKTALAMGG
ncbi:hypothetical protein NDU88_003710 [Pleurodeles waltl]|uniref:Uncharacterized protein n=1 Tax=Pleurodeles waltl TaxID=8319 RepID=A0AAV7T626_PLEWA|nr:hypothetical protein NDU88_003710 [Pleurodeles waltl]